MFNSELESNTTGLGLFMLKKKPKPETEKGPLYGYREDYNGLGAFVHKNRHDKWVLTGLLNKGMTKHGDLPKLSINTNSCEVAVETGQRIGIRVTVDGQTAEYKFKEAGDVEYKHCTTVKMVELFEPYILMSASNLKKDKKKKVKESTFADIDVLFFDIINHDNTRFSDLTKME